MENTKEKINIVDKKSENEPVDFVEKNIQM